jgi:hypothetical protein
VIFTVCPAVCVEKAPKRVGSRELMAVVHRDARRAGPKDGIGIKPF